jgi:hypothetical protein
MSFLDLVLAANKDLPVVIYYDVAETVTLGKYTVEIYMDEEKIGQSFFTIEK